jgi:YidC/Oxa1 family membrane protein insertase
VSVFTLPLYFAAEKWQRLERDTQKRFGPKIAKIKAVFKGDEQYLVLSAYYRQNHYHPVYALRSTFGLLIQIPFFIAAYSCLSNMAQLRGASFFFIRDLGSPDGLFHFGGFSVNFLPVLMTLINCAAGAIYTRGFQTKEKIQLYGMAGIFLILLYHSPSGLVLYWTANNVFSLAKNILQKNRYAGKIIFGTTVLFAALLDFYLLFFQRGDLPKRLLAMALFSWVFFIPLIKKISTLRMRKVPAISEKPGLPAVSFFLSTIILFLLTGIIIPSSLIASSVIEFSFLGSFASPFPFILHTALQAAGIFLFWAIACYLLLPSPVKRGITVCMVFAAAIALVDVFLVSENFGFLTNTLIFSDPKPLGTNPIQSAANAAGIAAVSGILTFLLLRKKTAAVNPALMVALLSLAVFGITNSVRISQGFAAARAEYEDNTAMTLEPVYHFSKTGKNVVLMMIDCVIGAYVPYIFEEKPELREDFAGFAWYPNCVSFADHTLVGALPVFGGYEYTPAAVNERDTVPLVEKQKEAYLLLPTLFSDAGYSVTVTDPPFDNYQLSNLSIFQDYPDIKAENLLGKYTSHWMQTHPSANAIDIASLLQNKLIRFSFFKSAPVFLRGFMYDDGGWLALENSAQNGITPSLINDYALFDTLPHITGAGETGSAYMSIYNHLPHGAALLQTPDYTPPSSGAEVPVNRSTSILANDGRYNTTMAAFLLLGKWFRKLKELDVYDNTRLILVSDHGRGNTDYPGNSTLPDGSRLQSYNALLMVKDFQANTPLSTGASFMTNADAALFAVDSLFDNPVNPFTKKLLQSDKEQGAYIATIPALSTYRHSKFTYNIGKNEWLHVHDNIFDVHNWSRP